MTANGELDGRVAIVTGAGQGMGRAVALRLSGGGASLVVNDVNSEAAESTCALIAERGGEAVAAPGDVTSSDRRPPHRRRGDGSVRWDFTCW